ncbi:endonuclease III [Humisphaera borealis]|uniref:Endonuclease III n=1 Tax=Humisphaera borealis TaxID=2807512 RepID=A0A7M2WWQ3_9BACT|nr:endonuclease III [Humisphaera borealis]QOV89967.1 endonuclease III [Humisphaera borealis]
MPRPAPLKVTNRRGRVEAILPILKSLYPDATCRLDHSSPLELLVATILSAQCTDDRVNIVTRTLFKKYRTAADYARVSQEELEKDIQTTGFFRNKARSIRGMAAALISDHGGKVPDTMEQLTPLPGVGRKTANVVLGNAFGKNVGVTVDTHVTRLSNRLGLTDHEEDAVKIEQDLIKIVPQEDWALWSHLLIFHGRKVCMARNPLCSQCPLLSHCPSGPKIIKDKARTEAARSVAKRKKPGSRAD